MARPLDEMRVAEFLDAFRERKLEDQQASPVWQALVQFPQWGLAQYKPEKPGPQETQALPDPRLPPMERAEILREQGIVTDDSKEKSPNTGAMVSSAVGQKQNPWAEYKEPSPGFAFICLSTEVPPPWPGVWTRRPEGWCRKA